MGTQVTTRGAAALSSLSGALAKRFGMESSDGVIDILRATAFKGPASDDQLAALLIVANHIEIADDGCWNWVGATSQGYGQLTFNGKHQTAHRFVFNSFVEQIKDGMWVLHHCDNRRCVNPRHLYQGTPIDNRADMLNRKRWSHPWAKRTHCTKGHEYMVSGFSIAKDGSRVCLICQRDHKRNQRATKKGV